MKIEFDLFRIMLVNSGFSYDLPLTSLFRFTIRKIELLREMSLEREFVDLDGCVGENKDLDKLKWSEDIVRDCSMIWSLGVALQNKPRA